VRGREEVPATTIIKSQQRIFEVSKMKFYPPLYYSSEKEKEKEKKSIIRLEFFSFTYIHIPSS
jgi:hypothetical protein